jgi:hypothetical protein
MAIHGFAHAAWIIGDTRDERRAWALGVESTDRVTPFAHLPSSAVRRVRHLAGERFGAAVGGPPQIVCCYSLPALGLARAALGRRRPWRLGILAGAPKDLGFSADVDRQAAYAMHDATVATFSRALQNTLAPTASARRGGTYLRDAIRLFDAPASFNVIDRIDPSARDRLRAALGLEPSDTVIALLADPPEHADAARVLFELGLCFTVGHRLIGLVRSGATRERRGARFVRDHGRRWDLLHADLSLAEQALACDIAIIGSAGVRGPIGSAGPIGAAVCAQLQRPLIIAPSAYPAGVDDDLPPAIVATDDSRRAVAAALLKTLESDPLRAEIKYSQQAWGERAKAANRFAGTLAELWHELNDTPSEGSPAAATGVAR